MNSNQQRAWATLDIGPRWVLRPNSEQQACSETTNSQAAAQAVAQTPASATPVHRANLDWDGLAAAVSGCQQCQLCESRRNTVFGVGARHPRWLIIGEAPGEQEDRSGEPFVGEAGQLLDAMLHSVGAGRHQNVFVMNLLKCRPPANRDPLPEEVASCRPFLMRQIQLLEPSLILTVGRFAAQALLQTDEGIGKLRGQVHQFAVDERPIPLVASYHPAYFLRRPEEKRKGWQDLCLAMSVVAPADPG